MPHLDIAPGESLFYEYEAPTTGRTFVFVNPLAGNSDLWQDKIGPSLRQAGHGTLVYNFRGQIHSTSGVDTDLAPELIVEDLKRISDHVKPPRPILVGLSIGGLFAAQGYLAGVPADGLVLMNTLRKPSPRLEWINSAMVMAAATGGSQLIMEMNLPMLVNPEQLERMRPSMFTGEPKQPMGRDDGLYRLMAGSVTTDWDFPYERLDCPVLLMTGLHDRVFRIDEDIAELKARIPNAREIVYSDAGHMIPMERPETVTGTLLGFAEGL